MNMVKVFIGKRESKFSYIPVLFPNLGSLKDERHLFADRGFRAFTEKVVELVDDLSAADFILLPYDYFSILERDRAVFDEYLALSKKSGKKILIFDFSDYSERSIDVPNSWIFRVAGYRHHWRENEIMMPYFVEDLCVGRPIEVRIKGEKPVIGFCGWAGFKTWRAAVKAKVKMVYLNMLRYAQGDKEARAHEQGIFLRIAALKRLAASSKVLTNFIVRRAYGSHKATIELSPEEARRQYIENMENSDLALAVRGDSNFSQRFYEALSLGRIPLLIDTDCVLPLENELRYDEFMIRVDHRDIGRIGDIVAERYRALSPEDFKKMQQRAREVFENYLKADSFFAYVLPKLIVK